MKWTHYITKLRDWSKNTCEMNVKAIETYSILISLLRKLTSNIDKQLIKVEKFNRDPPLHRVVNKHRKYPRYHSRLFHIGDRFPGIDAFSSHKSSSCWGDPRVRRSPILSMIQRVLWTLCRSEKVSKVVSTIEPNLQLSWDSHDWCEPLHDLLLARLLGLLFVIKVTTNSPTPWGIARLGLPRSGADQAYLTEKGDQKQTVVETLGEGGKNKI